MIITLDWQKSATSPEADLYVGTVRVACIRWQALGKYAPAWTVKSYLPTAGIPDNLNRMSTPEQARAMAEAAVTKWFAAIEPAITMSRRPRRSDD